MSVLYWNNICLISKMEEEYINKQLENSNININVEYFGLGRKESLLSHFQNNNKILADFIVTTDTDVIQDSRFKSIYENFEDITKFITIPLVIIYNENSLYNLNPPTSYADLLKDEYKYKYAFGGENNSAGKSLVKSIWYKYGYDNAKKIVDNGNSNKMPAQAFQKVMTGEFPIAIVPTIFALRNGNRNIKMVWPQDGAIPIHSYVAIKKDVANEQKQFFKNKIISSDLQKELVEKAAIVADDKNISLPNLNVKFNGNFIEPDDIFLSNLDHEQIYALLNKTKKDIPSIDIS